MTRFSAFSTFIGASFLTTVLSIILPSTSLSHGDEKPVWALSPAESAELAQELIDHRDRLLVALNEASEFGIPASSLRRPYRFDSDKEVVDIPRSVLNRVIQSSLALETATMKSYVFCEVGCEHSLKKDGATEVEAAAVRGLWPKIKSSFELLWHDIPIAIWMRVANAHRYSRSLMGAASYQFRAYGPASATAGAVAFGGAFVATEIAESMMMGPLHIVCQANYFWSVALGTAIASLARDVKVLFQFDEKNTSLISRLFGLYGRFRDLREFCKTESRVLYESLSGLDKVSRRDAHSGALKKFMEHQRPARFVASDAFLWAELLDIQSPDKRQGARFTDLVETERLLDTELERMVTSGEKGTRMWQDLHASLRTTLRAFRFDVDARHIREGGQLGVIGRLGKLDRALREIDIFMRRSLREPLPASLVSARATWVRGMVSEWLALSIEASSPDFLKPREFEVRLSQLKSTIDKSIRAGKPLDVAPPKPESLTRASSGFSIKTCESSFVSVFN